MNNTRERVAACFSNVFPSIRPDEIPSASTGSLPAWDSLGHVTLLSAIAEDFGVDFEVEDFEELISYALIVKRLENKFANA